MTAGAIIEYLSSGDISLVSLHLVYVYTGALPRLKWPRISCYNSTHLPGRSVVQRVTWPQILSVGDTLLSLVYRVSVLSVCPSHKSLPTD